MFQYYTLLHSCTVVCRLGHRTEWGGCCLPRLEVPPPPRPHWWCILATVWVLSFCAPPMCNRGATKLATMKFLFTATVKLPSHSHSDTPKNMLGTWLGKEKFTLAILSHSETPTNMSGTILHIVAPNHDMKNEISQ